MSRSSLVWKLKGHVQRLCLSIKTINLEINFFDQHYIFWIGEETTTAMAMTPRL